MTKKNGKRSTITHKNKANKPNWKQTGHNIYVEGIKAFGKVN